jgi:hypothetical protein
MVVLAAEMKLPEPMLARSNLGCADYLVNALQLEGSLAMLPGPVPAW